VRYCGGVASRGRANQQAEDNVCPLKEALTALAVIQWSGLKLSIEHKGIICEVLGRQLFPSRHHFERINLTRCTSNTGFALWDRPSCNESHDQSGNTDSEQSLAHSKSPRLGSGPSNGLDGRN
jgi:hypothetical protein